MTVLETRALGETGMEITRVGFGAWAAGGGGWSFGWGPQDDAASIAAIRHSVELGVNWIDTAAAYGLGHSEEVVAAALEGFAPADRPLVFTKCGTILDPRDPMAPPRRVGDPASVRREVEASLRRLGVDVIDLYYQHRVDPATPIEETVGAMAGLVRAGKVRFIGLSEAGAATLRRAHAVHPLTVLQSEYSLWTRDPEESVLAACRELGIGFVAYSPLGRGFLTGRIKRIEDFAPDDYRPHTPRFQGENFQRNLDLVRRIEQLAAQKGCRPSQLALAWVLAQGEDIVPIPGTKRRTFFNENLGALDLALTPAEVKQINDFFPPGVASGPRYPETMQKSLGR